jgi:hypothetical protein
MRHHERKLFMTDPSYGSTVDPGQSTTGQGKDQVRERAQLAQDKTRGALGQARGRLSDQVDQRSTEAGERIAGTAGDVRSIAQELRGQGKDTPANLAEQVADQADRVGDYLKGASGDRILRDVEDFARRQPMLVAAAGLALGFAASRFLKASSSRRYQTGYDWSDTSQRMDDAAAVPGAASISDPTYNGSDYSTESLFTQADVVAPVAGSDAPAVQPVTQVTEPSDHVDSRRDLDPSL